MDAIGFLWNEIVTRPMTNGLIFFYSVLLSNFGLAIIGFTLATRVLLYPLTMRQLRSTKAMQALQPRIKEIQERYKNDRQRLQQEQLKLFREAGVNPIGCLGPIMVQTPIWIGLFYALRDALADTPEALVTLSQKLYSWLPLVDEAVPLNSVFLGMDLGETPADGPLPILMPLLVGGSMWMVQKMSTLPTMDPRQKSMNTMMMWMWPIMFGFWTLSFYNGLALYWLASNLISIALQYRVTGWGGLARQPALAPSAAVVGQASGGRAPRGTAAEVRAATAAEATPSPASVRGNGPIAFLKRVFLGNPQPPAPNGATTAARSETNTTRAEEEITHGTSGGDRQDGRRGDRAGSQRAGGPARRRRHRRRR